MKLSKSYCTPTCCNVFILLKVARYAKYLLGGAWVTLLEPNPKLLSPKPTPVHVVMLPPPLVGGGAWRYSRKQTGNSSSSGVGSPFVGVMTSIRK